VAEQVRTKNEIREAVRDRYAEAALAAASSAGPSCCSTAEAECGCGPSSSPLGCGNPTAVADLHDGEVVLDLGSGGGADVFISAARVGPEGRAYGVDMTDEMLELARRNQHEAGVENVEFLKGTIEDVPLPDDSVDVVISNCVINLSADKPAVFREAARVLRPGGRFAVTDIVADAGMDEETRGDLAQWTACIAGALSESEFRRELERAGFSDVELRETHRVHEQAGSAIIRARIPANSAGRLGLIGARLDG
jgi:arsenite methyltransferase